MVLITNSTTLTDWADLRPTPSVAGQQFARGLDVEDAGTDDLLAELTFIQSLAGGVRIAQACGQPVPKGPWLPRTGTGHLQTLLEPLEQTTAPKSPSVTPKQASQCAPKPKKCQNSLEEPKGDNPRETPTT